jgi:hypothetical protein
MIPQVHFYQPRFKFWGWKQMQKSSQVKCIMKGGTLIVQHDIIGARDSHDIGATRSAEQSEKIIHVILVGFGMIGIAHITTHR